ncbi:Exopolyphosphatase [Ceratobasidium sp. 414]|nr:Exopolyphosphatase [Ceratobasidium sp. 414]
MISAVRNHLRSKILPYLQAPFTSITTKTAPLASSSNMSTLSAFLLNNKQSFLANISSNRGEGWTIVMGNEAGDLDSCTSAIAHSYLSTTLDNTRTIALIQTPRVDLALRPENLLAFQLAHLDPNRNDLLTIDDITTSIPLSNLRTSFVLVDHNRLLPKFITEGADRVTAIFDHHADEKQHTNANPRIISPTGSCASIIASHFQSRFPSNGVTTDVTSLLLSAILVDTGGLKKKEDGGKADATDLAASKFLYPLSRFGVMSTTGQASTESKTIPDLTELLFEAKRTISHLSGRDLLRRDYKEYEFGLPGTGNFTRVGLSTVPMALDDWIERDGSAKFWSDQAQWISERSLTFSGVLTTFRTKKKQKHKREMLAVFPSAEGAVADAPTGLEKKLYESIEADEVLDAERRDLEGIEGRRARAWEQRNGKATRKQVAPAIKAIIEGGW